MRPILAAALASLVIALGTQACTVNRQVTIAALQGGWWSDCSDSAVVFFIDGENYTGDFLGTYELELSEDILTFSSGLPEGHSLVVTNQPLSFLVLEAEAGQLVLEPTGGNPYRDIWHLYRCDEDDR